MTLDLAVLIIGDKPGEGAIKIVMKLCTVTSEREAARDLVDELLAALAREKGSEVLEIDQLGGNDGGAAERRLPAQRLEIGKTRHRILALRGKAAPVARYVGADCGDEKESGPRGRSDERTHQHHLAGYEHRRDSERYPCEALLQGRQQREQHG